MNKSLVGCLVLLSVFTSCTKSEVTIVQPWQGRPPHVPAINLPFTTMISIQNCPVFVSDSSQTLQTMIFACNAANFEFINVNIETINSDVYSIVISGDHGFATLWIDKGLDACMVEFFCADDTYSLEDFVFAFMAEFNTIEHRDEWFEALIEDWENNEPITTS